MISSPMGTWTWRFGVMVGLHDVMIPPKFVIVVFRPGTRLFSFYGVCSCSLCRNEGYQTKVMDEGSILLTLGKCYGMEILCI